MEDKSELFIYAGRMVQEGGSLHVFVHTLKNNYSNNTIEKASVELYNIMVHETMIQKGDAVFVYNITGQEISCVQISPPASEKAIIVDVPIVWKRIMLAAHRPPYLVVKVYFKNSEVEVCHIYEIDPLELGTLFNMLGQQKNVKFGDISHYRYTKNIEYLDQK